jgi:hypothetical protein
MNLLIKLKTILQFNFFSCLCSDIENLKLALTWNRIDVAKNFIFKDDNRFKTEFLTELMFIAINKDKVDFVREFINQGFNWSRFLNYRRLIKLYNEVIALITYSFSSKNNISSLLLSCPKVLLCEAI